MPPNGALDAALARMIVLDESLERVQTLRDEIGLRLHLATEAAKAEWNALQPKLLDAEQRLVSAADHEAQQLLNQLLLRLVKLNALIDGG